MVIPGRAKWLKEFFDVRVVVSNLGSSDFSFQHGTVGLGTLPSGLSLAPTKSPQALTQTLPDVPGGQSADADWVVRGDTEGFYTLRAQYSGSLEPLGSAIHLVAMTATNALHVWGGSALHMVVDADNTAAIGAPYRVRILLVNVADVPVFNPSIEFLEPGRVNYIYQPGEKLVDETDAIQPGATFPTHYYRLVPEISGTLVPSLSFVKKTAGNTDVASTITSHPAVAGLPVTGTHNGTALTLTWNAPPVTAPAHIDSYRIYFTPDRNTAFGATPLATIPNPATHTITFSHASAGNYVVSTVVSGVPTMFHTMYGLATAPQSTTATAGNGTATVHWTAPASNGGAAVTGYVVTPTLTTPSGPVDQPAKTFASTATTQTITGLTNAKSYSFSVAAKNANGRGSEEQDAEGHRHRSSDTTDRSRRYSGRGPGHRALDGDDEHQRFGSDRLRRHPVCGQRRQAGHDSRGIGHERDDHRARQRDHLHVPRRGQERAGNGRAVDPVDTDRGRDADRAHGRDGDCRPEQGDGALDGARRERNHRDHRLCRDAVCRVGRGRHRARSERRSDRA